MHKFKLTELYEKLLKKKTTHGAWIMGLFNEISPTVPFHLDSELEV